MFYPGEEVVRFVNRYIRRKIGPESYTVEFETPPTIVDVGFGAGRHMAYFLENGFHAIGLELSTEACAQAKSLLEHKNISTDAYQIINSSSDKIDLAANSVDYGVSVSAIDSMPTDTAKATMQQVHACLKPGALFYVDVISDRSIRTGTFKGSMDQVVEETHESGTIQSYYDENKIAEVFSLFDVVRQELHTRTTTDNTLLEARWHLVLRK